MSVARANELWVNVGLSTESIWDHWQATDLSRLWKKQRVKIRNRFARGLLCIEWRHKIAIFDQYLASSWNDTTFGHSYNGILIGTYTRLTQRCKFEWPWVTEWQQNTNDKEHRAASLRQLSFLFISWKVTCQRPTIRDLKASLCCRHHQSRV